MEIITSITWIVMVLIATLWQTPGYHPEVDTSDPFDADATHLYQSYAGTIRWCIELGRIDICLALRKLSSYLACPRI
jgi:hypothetical protein